MKSFVEKGSGGGLNSSQKFESYLDSDSIRLALMAEWTSRVIIDCAIADRIPDRAEYFGENFDFTGKFE